jgi:bacteriocin biosynthesis cyclodehydratase domain-containing protein
MFRPVLAPGLQVLRRSRTELQVGLRPALRLPDTEPVRRTLDRLVRGEVIDDDPETRRVLAVLAPVLVDSAGLVVPDVAPAEVAAIAARDPAGYQGRLAARRRTRVFLDGSAPGVRPELMLGSTGLELTDQLEEASVVLLIRAGEIDRADVDGLLRASTPHLLVRLVEAAAVLGPFVEPGRTACLRCLDAHRALDEPLAGMLVARHLAAAAERQDGVAEPVDSTLATLAVAWAARDLLTYAEGDRPSTWSSTVHLAPTLATVSRTEWLRHPACGCSWTPDTGPDQGAPR